MNLGTIAAALATRFVGVTLANGNGFAAEPTSRLPNNVAKGPVCLVYPPSGPLEIGVGRMRNDHYDFPVKILIDPLNMPTRSDLMYAWFDATRDRVEGDIDLGLAYVAKATLVFVRMEIDGETYPQSDGVVRPFDVIEYTVRVLVREVVATVTH